MELLKVNMNFVAPYRPQANGICERVNGTLVRIIWKLVAHYNLDWDLVVPIAIFAYNISYHSVTNYSPFRILYGRKPSTPSTLYPLLVKEEEVEGTGRYLWSLTCELIQIQTDAYQSLSHHVASRQERDNKGRLPVRNYSPDDKVYIYQTFGHGQRTKLDMVWSPKATILC